MRTHLISALSDAAVTRLKKERVSDHESAQEERTARDHRGALDRQRSRVRHLQRRELATRGRLARSLASLSRRSAQASSARRRTHLHLCFYPHDCRQWTAIVSEAAQARHHHVVGLRLERTAHQRSRPDRPDRRARLRLRQRARSAPLHRRVVARGRRSRTGANARRSRSSSSAKPAPSGSRPIATSTSPRRR